MQYLFNSTLGQIWCLVFVLFLVFVVVILVQPLLSKVRRSRASPGESEFRSSVSAPVPYRHEPRFVRSGYNVPVRPRVSSGLSEKRLRQDDIVPYNAKSVLTEPEQVLFFRLVDAFPGLVVIAQVQMSSFLSVSSHAGRWRQVYLNRILRKSADFLICNKDFSVFAAVELQDRTHDRPDRRKSDEFKRSVLSLAGLRLVEFHVSKLPSVEDIRKVVLCSKGSEHGF
jgi:hypothetical protein